MSTSVVQIGRGPGRLRLHRPPEHCVRRPRRAPGIERLARTVRARGPHSLCEEARRSSRLEALVNSGLAVGLGERAAARAG